MDSSDTLSALLTKLTASFESAQACLPEEAKILPPQDGISLLDIKNELFLQYLQNLVFLIILKLQKLSPQDEAQSQATLAEAPSQDALVKKLGELRVYLDRGVRPLEARLKYQIDKVFKAADAASRQENSRLAASRKRTSPSGSASDRASDEDSSEDSSEEEIDALSYRPNPAAFAPSKETASTGRSGQGNATGVYRPPKITPTSLPTTDVHSLERKERPSRPFRSSAVDDYIDEELSTAPAAHPSIGSNLTPGGRGDKSRRDRAKEAERRLYEETNFVRLPGENKKEKRKRERKEREDDGFAELKGLGEGADRVARATAKKERHAKALRAAMQRERLFTTDGPRGDGLHSGSRGAQMKRRRFK